MDISVILLFHLGENLVPDLYLHNALAHGGHSSLDVHASTLKGKPTAVGLLSDKAILLLVVVHLFVEALVAFFALVIDSYSYPVFVQVVVIRHREHYCYDFFAAVGMPLKQLVSQNAYSA